MVHKADTDRNVTQRELSRWLARGNGEICFYRDDVLSDIKLSYYNYESDDEPVTEVMVRRWEETEWHHPTYKYFGLEE